MTAEKVVVDADLWEWLRDGARHDEGCNGDIQKPCPHCGSTSCSRADGTLEPRPCCPDCSSHPWGYRCRCGFRDIAPRLDTAVPVVAVERSANAQWWRSEL